MTTDDNNGWDSLAEEFGLESSQEPPKAEKPAAPAARPAPRPAPRRPAHERHPEPEPEGNDFGSGVVNDTGRDQAALYDPGPDAVAEDAEDLGAAPEPLDEPEGEESLPGAEGHDGGKKRRRRRRRRKKGGPGAPEATASAEEGAEDSAPEAVEDGGVEEGEAPAEVEGDEEDETIPSAVDEEMEAEAAVPRNEWHVMTWNELVAKLHRPG